MKQPWSLNSRLIWVCFSILIAVCDRNCVDGEFNRVFKFDPHVPAIGASELQENGEILVFKLRNPITVYGTPVAELTIYRNGWIQLGRQATEHPLPNYPEGTQSTGQRLQDYDGQYLAVFTSVANRKTGSVSVREIAPIEYGVIGCWNSQQIERILQLIRLRRPNNEHFSPNSLIAVTWKNITNAAGDDYKSNSYSLIILSNQSLSYAVIQYWNIEWPKLNQIDANALPPEAGVFVNQTDGFQLPRSGHSVDTFHWTGESNVAVPGEWLIPLHESSVDSADRVAQLSHLAETFVRTLQLTCPVEFGHSFHEVTDEMSQTRKSNVLNDSPRQGTTGFVNSSFELDPYGYTGELEDEEDYLIPDPLGSDPVRSTDSFWPVYEEDEITLPHAETLNQPVNVTEISYTDPGKPNSEMTPIVPVTDMQLGLYDGDEQRFYTAEPTIIPKTAIPLEERPGGYVAYTESLHHTSYSTMDTCDPNAHCTVPDTECFTVEGRACCACRSGYYGSGQKHCWPEASEDMFAFRGLLNASLGGVSAQFQLYLDIQNGQTKRSSSGVRGGFATDPNFQVVRLLTPMFHVFNALIATTCDADTNRMDNQEKQQQQTRVYNLLTLGAGFQTTFNIRFYFDLDHVGKLTANAQIRLDKSLQTVHPRGTINVELSAPEGITQAQRVYREAVNVADTPGQTYYTSYQLDQYGRILFPERSVKFVAEPRGHTGAESGLDELTVRWSAIATVDPGDDHQAADDCLVRPGGPISQDHVHFVKMLDRGYCGEDCSASDSSCNLFCIDIPLLLATEPDACSCVRCPGQREYCKVDGTSYHCECLPGLRRMEDHTCRADDGKSAAAAKPQERCGTLYCHSNARCIDQHQSLCQCLPGYRGDGVANCEDDPCARCQRNEVCENDQCRPTGVDLCEGIRCGKQAFCRDGACVCTAGYTGDPMVECIEERELCAGVQCHRFAQCYQNRCYCSHGYVGDGLNFCDVHTEDPCDGVRCAPNGECHEGRCTCSPGYMGDGYHECRAVEDKCANVICHNYAQCYDGHCRCADGYQGDGYRECVPMGRCSEPDCHPNAHCVDDRCQCKPGYEGDGYSTCNRRSSGDPSQCGKCRGIPHKELAQCIDGQCVCASGFIQAHPGVCIECVQANCHQDASCLPTAQYNGAFSCQCKAGFQGDGVTSCVPIGTFVDPTCGGGCRVRNAECNPSTGRCECRRGYTGDGHINCMWNCQQCVRDAVCDQQNERCTCKSGYHGDGTMFCEPIPTRPDPVKVHITGQGDVLRVADLDKPLVIRCMITTSDESITGQWIQPNGAQTAQISITRLAEGTENILRITKPTLTDAGRYFCRAGSAEAYLDVAIEETAIPYDIFLTSDDGILKVKSSGKNTTLATIWNLAENNKYGRIAMATDCNRQRVIYTSDYGHAVRWGDAQAKQKELTTQVIFESQLNRFRNLVVDPPSGNIFAWDEAFGRLVVLNPSKPQMKYTLDTIGSFKQAEPLRFAGLTLHSTQGLIYWAVFTDGWMPNGTIQVASMAGQNERQLLQLSGEPLAISLSPSYDKSDSSAGRLCWIQRSLTDIFALATEMHCARLSADGLTVITQERLRQFNPTEEPSWGMVHHRGTVLWTDASRPIYYSANPAKRVHVRHVCCSNRFQAISALATCNSALTNSCGYSNGRCRYFCLPGMNQGSRTCVCPDSEIGCHKEV